MNYNLLEYKSHGDDDGMLVALEENKEIPFAIKRVFHIYNTRHDVVRGKHAHKTLEEVLICVNGSCKVLLDDGKNKEIVLLDSPKKGLYIPPNLWREMFEFDTNTVLVILASEKYEINDYIKDYNEYLELNNN